MTLLTKKDILQAKDFQEETVKVPEWGGEIRVRGLTATERDSFEHELFDQADSPGMKIVRSSLCARCIIDEKGDRLFSDADIKALGNKSAVALNRVFQVAQKLSGLRKEDVEELAKN